LPMSEQLDKVLVRRAIALSADFFSRMI